MSETVETTKAPETPDFQAMIDSAVRSAMDQIKPKQERKTVEVDSQDSSITVSDVINPWERDAAMFINAMTMKKRGRHVAKANRIINEIVSNRHNLNDKQRVAEMREAYRIVKESNLSKAAKTRVIQNISTPDEGGNLLPKPFFAEVFVRIEEFGVARRLFRGIPMSSDSIDLKNVLTKPVVGWNGELSPGPLTGAEFGNTLMQANKLMAITAWSQEFQEDEVFGYLPLITELLAESIAEREDTAGFVGAGAGDTANAEFTGMLYLPGNLTTDLTSQNGADVDFDDISTAIHKLTLKAKQNAVIFAHPEFEGIFERITDNEGRYLYKYPGAEMGVPRLWNKPVEYVQAMPSPSDVAEGDETPFIAIGNPVNMLFGNRSGIQIDVSTEGTIRATNDDTIQLSAFQDDAALLRVKERIAFQSVIPNSFSVIRTAKDD